MISIEQIFIAAGIVFLLSVFASKVSENYGIPALLLFLVLGMLVGSEGPGGIYFDNASLAQALGVTALALILFSGGLDTSWSEVRPISFIALVLSTVGVLITAGVIGILAWFLLGFTLLGGLLLGSIISSTDAAAVFSILRSRNIGLPPQVKSLLELESGSNDPMAVFLSRSHWSLGSGIKHFHSAHSDVSSADGAGRGSRLRPRLGSGLVVKPHWPGDRRSLPSADAFLCVVDLRCHRLPRWKRISRNLRRRLGDGQQELRAQEKPGEIP